MGAAARRREALLGSCAGCGAEEASDGWVHCGVGLAVVAAGRRRRGPRRRGGARGLSERKEGAEVLMAHHRHMRH